MEEEGGSFCVRCGGTEPPFLGALCVRCFSERNPLVGAPTFLDVILCPTCGSRQVGNHWEKARGPEPERVLRSDLAPLLKVTPEGKLREFTFTETGANPKLRDVSVEAHVEVQGRDVVVPLRIEVHLIFHSCPACSRRGGNYFTARIQLRAAEEGLPRGAREFKPWAGQLWTNFLRSCAPAQRDSIAREEELKEGWDVLFTDTAIARTLARAFRDQMRATSKESASLWGLKNGREIYRVTFLVRLPAARPGDYLERDGRLVEVTSVRSEGRFRLQDVVSGVPREVADGDLSAWRFVAGPEGRLMLPLVRPQRGPPFVRVPGKMETLPLQGEVPETPALPAGLGSPSPPSEAENLPLVLGAREAWWAPHLSNARRQARRDSSH